MSEYWDEVGDPVDDIELDDRFCFMLDEAYGSFAIGDLEWDASTILREMDPIAFDIALGEYTDRLVEDGFIGTINPYPDDDDDYQYDGELEYDDEEDWS